MSLWQHDAATLARQLATGEITSVALVEALQARADATEPTINGFTRQRRTEALAEAARLDAERAAGRIRGPLHGLPITVKDNIDVAGLPTTVGLLADADCVAHQDAVIVARARAAGGIVLGKSNVPQALMAMHCDNNLYGPTQNPRSARHVTGGSSAGEGALIASGASVLGLGTDLGGSIRFPAAFCGIVGFKPTLDRWSNRGIASGLGGQIFVRPQVGPMGRSVADVALMLRALPAAAQSPFDGRVPPVPDAPAPTIAGRRIGVFEDDGFLSPAPVMQRAVRQAAAALEAAGATVVPYRPLHQPRLVELFLSAISSDGLETARRGFAGEAPDPGLRLMWRLGTAPGWARRGAAGLLDRIGEARLARIVRAAGEKRVTTMWALNQELARLRGAIEDTWRTLRLDAVICPAAATPAVPIDMARDAGPIFSYFARFNLLGMPAGVLPVTTATASDVPAARGDRLARRVAAIAAESVGLPVAVQVAAPRWRDATALAVMATIERAARPSVRLGDADERLAVRPDRPADEVPPSRDEAQPVARQGRFDGGAVEVA